MLMLSVFLHVKLLLSFDVCKCGVVKWSQCRFVNVSLRSEDALKMITLFLAFFF